MFTPIFDDSLAPFVEGIRRQSGKANRKDATQNIRNALSVVLANLFRLSGIHPDWSIRIDLSNDGYPKGEFNPHRLNASNIRAVVSYLEKHNPPLIRRSGGNYDRKLGKGYPTKIEPSFELKQMICEIYEKNISLGKETNINRTNTITRNVFNIVSDIKIHGRIFHNFKYPTIRLKSKKIGGSFKYITFDDTDDIKRMRNNLEVYNGTIFNSYWIDILVKDSEFHNLRENGPISIDEFGENKAGSYCLDLISRRKLYRVFNDGTFQHGGRFYGGWWQDIPKKYRRYITINGQPTVEIDYSNMQIAMLYEGLGIRLDAQCRDEEGPYPNLCFVDTLDNVAGLGIKAGHQHDLFGAMSEENVERVKRQNKRKISVIIGNPPYNANQANENNNNKNREYKRIDELIKSSYIRLSTAQKTKAYDMYARFFRWASDRLADDGVLAFITNRSFIDSRTFDGFRRAVEQEFNEIFVVDLGGDVRANPKLSGTKHNVFGIQTGVAISFFIKRHKQKGCKVFYARRPEFDTAEDKLGFLSNTKLSKIPFDRIEPDRNANWINLSKDAWDDLIPVADKKTKLAKGKSKEKAIFRLFSNGIVTARDEWTIGFNKGEISDRINLLISHYTEEQKRWKKSQDASVKDTSARLRKLADFVDRSIKWTSELEVHLDRGTSLIQKSERIVATAYRPFIQPFCYYDRVIVHRLYQQGQLFPIGKAPNNVEIGFSGISSSKPFQTLVVDQLPSYDFLEKTQFLPRYRYTAAGERADNITNWALKEFQKTYGKADGRTITKDSIFHYVYGVLHDPIYREKYALNLKREFPRIPFYPDFWRWAEWGERLMNLHIHYENIDPWPLDRLDRSDQKVRETGVSPKVVLKADKENGIIRLDTETQLSGIPDAAWSYRLGNRSGLEWILDQYREKVPKDPTIREKFDTYRFADYKEKVIDLLCRVTRVSVETMVITEAMRQVKRVSQV